jgi:hypothetical protein
MARGYCGRHRPCRADDGLAYDCKRAGALIPGKQDVLPGDVDRWRGSEELS